jgi:uncharacterized cupredoxin-like copper-binding protein
LLTIPPRWAGAIGCPLTIALLAAGCGGQAASTSAPPPQAVDVSLTEFRFTPDPIEAPSGRTTFHLANAGRTGHDFTILSADGHRRLAQSPLIGPGSDATLAIILQAGTYRVICTQPGHQEAGMEAVLEVSGGGGR